MDATHEPSAAGFALGVGAFVGLWAGVGFGLMAGNATYQAKFFHH